MEGVFLIFILFVIVIAVPIGIASSRKADQSWSNAAKTLGLHFQQGGLFGSRRISGTYQNFGVNIDTYSRGSNENRRTYTRIIVSYSSLGLGLGLSAEGFVSGVTKFFGAQDIQIGDQKFDQDVLVKGHDADRVREFLTTARQLRIRRFFSAHSGAKISDSSIEWSESGVISDERRLTRLVGEIVRMAKCLTLDEDKVLQEALDEQDLGHTEKAITLLKEHRQQTPSEPDPGEAFLEGELLYLTGQTQDAQARFDQAQSASPEDVEIKEWADALHQIPATTKTSPESEEPKNTPFSTDAVCEALFAEQRSSYRITQEFEEQYEGKSIEWSGRLRRVERYSYDMVFGSGPGCRALIEIDTLKTQIGSQIVTAIVQYPEEAYRELDGKEGELVDFAGVLTKVDGLMRKIYVRSESA